jgi:hypothetical protein
MEMDLKELSRDVERLTRANDAESIQWQRNNLPPLTDVNSTSASLIAGTYTGAEVAAMLPRLAVAWPVMRADGDLRGAYQVRLTAFGNRVFYLQRMLESTAGLRNALQIGFGTLQ